MLMSGTRTALASGRVTADFKDYGWVSPKATEGIKAAFGVEYRNEFLYVHPDTPWQNGDGAGQGGPTLPVEGTYNVKEFFSEGVVPLVQDAKAAKDLSLELGYRLSNYSSTGTHSTYKVQGSWAPTTDLKLRVGYNRATRSPNITELYTPQGLGLGGSQDICAGSKPSATAAQCALQGVTAAQYGNVLENPAGQYNTFGGGNPALSPETADTYTFGAVFTPKSLPGFSATLDYYDIKINETIGTLGAEDIQNQCAKHRRPVPVRPDSPRLQRYVVVDERRLHDHDQPERRHAAVTGHGHHRQLQPPSGRPGPGLGEPDRHLAVCPEDRHRSV